VLGLDARNAYPWSVDPATLPIYEVESELLEALSKHRVVVVEGATGSGKTTQIPRILLHGLKPRCIAVTQPRRVAAVSVAWRIATEENVELGREVGFGIRFDDQSCAETKIKLMTDGLMLSEARTDPNLSRYDIIMIDEAHERSLNIDVTLGLLYEILQQRNDLKVVVSSATLLPEQYQEFFRPVAGHVPLVSVQAKSHAVEIMYSPPASTHPQDLAEHIAAGIESIHRHRPPGHILVFLSGEGIIHRITTELEEVCPDPDLVVLPLYGRLTREEQEQVFDDFGDKRKVILATNIAETSITIPDVRYVIDSGLAKVPHFRPRSGITELREEPISRASLMQRKGRAGRTGPGIVWRLFDESTLDERPERTEEEILRLDLAEAVLRLLDLGVKNVEHFPLPTPPPRSKLRAALDHLLALGAVDEAYALTRIGRRMTPFPLTPALARMVIEAAERFEKVVDDVLVVGAFMSGRSPWFLPEGEFDKAKAIHARLHHPMGDACTQLAVYRSWQKSGHKESFCKRHYLDFEVMQFTRRAHGQLREIARDQGIELQENGSAEHLVRALAAGLPDKVLLRDDNMYETLSGARLALHPGCALINDPPRFAVATEFVAYARPYAINVSVMRAAWIAEAHPGAARAFGIGKLRSAKPPAITQVQLGGVTFAVDSRQGKPTISIGLDQVDAVRRAHEDDLTAATRKIRGRVLWTEKHSFAAQRLPKLLKMIRSAPFPKPGSTPPDDIHLGDLQDVNRGRHHIEQGLGRLLEPATQGKSAGWVTLVANGAGGYWLDVVFHYGEAVKTSAVSLAELARELFSGDELLDRVEQLQQEIDDRLEETE
jgi:ATP-dependent helicase HrpA